MYNDPNNPNPYQQNSNQPFYNPGVTNQAYQHMYPPPIGPQKQSLKKGGWLTGQKKSVKLGLGCLTVIIVLVGGGMCSAIMNSVNTGAKVASHDTVESRTTPKPTTQNEVVQKSKTTAHLTVPPKSTPTPRPTLTPRPEPSLTPARVETEYKASTTDTTASAIDKDGSADEGNDVHFTCTILAFVKDTDGNTAGANVSDPNTSSIIQVEFTPGTDITQLNQSDALEVWGTDHGVSSGSNAFGATVQESVVQAQYMDDQTTGYQANS